MFRLPFCPVPTDDGAFSPSKLALSLATTKVTDFETVAGPCVAGEERILMVCTEERNMTMANGKKFSTGNHPVEMLLPMMHLSNAGFCIDVVTPTGAPVKIEMWAMPEEDDAVMAFYASFKDRFDNPGSVTDFVTTSLNDGFPYVGVFIPGGHGAMLGLPDNPEVGKLLRRCHGRDLHLLAICHGPAALLAAALPDPAGATNPTGNGEAFAYSGYELAAFPDRIDRQTPMIGYMPGQLPWHFGEKLTALGMRIVNRKADATCHVDRKLISGASPLAANDFGKLAVKELLADRNG